MRKMYDVVEIAVKDRPSSCSEQEFKKIGPSGKIKDNLLIGTVRTFAGIYSGRIDDYDLKAQQEIIGKAQVIDEIVSSIK